MASRTVSVNPASSYLQSLSKGSAATMGFGLKMVSSLKGKTVETMGWSKLRYTDVMELRSRLLDRGLGFRTVNVYLSALRGVAKESWRAGIMSTDNYIRLIDAQSVKGETLPKGRALSRKEIEALFAACTADRNGLRDAALFSLLYAGGLRRSEAVSLKLVDVTVTAGRVDLKVKGKGNKERLVILTNGAAKWLKAWIAKRGGDEGPLLNTRRGKGMSAQSVYNALERRSQEAGIPVVRPHDMRRTLASDMLDLIDAVTVSRFLGHSSVDTTALYDRRGERALHKAACAIHVPYARAS